MKSREIPSSFKIGSRTIGLDSPCLVIGEVAQSHDGSLGQAHAFIDAIAKAKVDAVKFQTHIAGAESTPGEPWRVKFSTQDASRYDYWRRMEFTEEQWTGLKQHAEDLGIIFLSSPFSIEAVELLIRLGMVAWKVASGEISNRLMLDQILNTGRPVLLSSGMSPLSEIDAIVEYIRAKGVPLALLQCTTAYPCPPEKIGLNVLDLFRKRYGCVAGLSDHSGTIYPGLAAVALGCEILEVHVTLSREMFGPDVPASITAIELQQLVEGVRFIETIRKHPVNKGQLTPEMTEIRQLFMKSVVARMDLRSGTILTEAHLTTKKPGTGIPAAHLPELLGRRVRRDLMKDECLNIDDFEEIK